MRCTQGLDENWELVVGYAARTLDPRAQASFEQHLKSCAACRETVAEQQAVWNALDELPGGAVSADFDGRLRTRIARREQFGWWQRNVLGRNWQAAMPAAAACIVLGVAFWVYHPRHVEVVGPSPMQVSPAAGSGQQALPAQDAQLDKLEHALDDMDMLGKLSGGRAPGKAGAANRI